MNSTTVTSRIEACFRDLRERGAKGLVIYLTAGDPSLEATGELLEAIERHHSIRQAAASLGMSYRRAWLLVQSINSACDARLVEATKGGNSGGGATVTPFGKEAIRRFHLLDRALHAAASRVMQRF